MRYVLPLLVLACSLCAADGPADAAQLEAKAMRGDNRAQVDLAFGYFRGEGVPRDMKRAFVWGTVADHFAPRDGSRSLFKMTSFASGELSEEELEKAQEEARQLIARIESAK